MAQKLWIGEYNIQKQELRDASGKLVPSFGHQSADESDEEFIESAHLDKYEIAWVYDEGEQAAFGVLIAGEQL
jgi:hypothetical protein